MSKRVWLVTVPLAAAVLGGCAAKAPRGVFAGRSGPNEFVVGRAQPLVVPPDFALVPPRPGAPRPQELSEQAQAEQALVPQAALGAGAGGSPSPGQMALLQAAGPTAPADIRAEVNRDASLNQPNQSFVDRLMFWRTPAQPGIVVDPEREAQRLRQNAALGQSPEAGDTPIIQPRTKGWLEGIF